MENCKYSIIIPIYNSVDTIEETILSIVNQSYSNFELILVDDGSDDGCVEVCKKYFYFDKRIRYVYTVNQGVSAARNIGLDMMSGQKVLFVDADDKLCEDCLEQISQYDEDLVLFGYEKLFEKQASQFCTYKDACYSLSRNVFTSLFDDGKLRTVWGKVFNAELIKKNHLLFHVDLDYAEDTVFACAYAGCCRTCRQLSYVGYVYRVGFGNTLSTPSKTSYERDMKSYKVLSDVCDAVYPLFSKSDVFLLRKYHGHINEITRVLALDSGFLDRYRQLTIVYKDGFIKTYGKQLDKYIEEDKRLVKQISDCNIMKLILFYDLAKLKRKVNAGN